MSVLTMVRHGQAAYMSLDYDRLSELGQVQCRKLAEFWLRHEFRFDTVVRGPAKRHRMSTEIVGAAYRDAGLPWPEPIVIDELDEFDAFRMMRLMVPILVEQNAEVRQLSKEYEDVKQTPEAGRRLQKLFEAVSRIWSKGEHEVQDLESWPAFRQRVSRAITQIRKITPQSTNTVAFTSGGPIAASIGYTLNLDHAKTIEFVWLTRNSSFSEFVFSGDRFSMESFNGIPHLDDRSLLTYR